LRISCPWNGEEIIRSSPLPVLVDGDDGYGDAKNVTRTIEGYERIGASAIFIEDQQAPKRCGHMSDKRSSRLKRW
jgi:2-methylisocitrate lyase-like PEP mutase family enzyme